MARSFKRNFIETHNDEYFSTPIFCGWDYCVVTKSLASLKAESLRTQIKVRSNAKDRKSVTLYLFVGT